jgi:hypothetical protein
MNPSHCRNGYCVPKTPIRYITQYGQGTLPVLALNGASTSIGICAFWSSTSIGTVHYWAGIKWCPYRYCHFCTFSSTSMGTVHYWYWH